jgi:hypothetical protein
MQNSKPANQSPMPSSATTRDGLEFDPTKRRWVLSRDNSLWLGWIDDLVDEPLLTGMLKALLQYAKTLSDLALRLRIP